jgi:16S rRNA pseudouridine516 synthase
MAEIYLMMNKPKGYVCSAASDSHKTVYELLPPELQDLVKNAKRGHRLHTIGRLDADTTGLLLLTTDGMFSHKIAASGVPEPVEGHYKQAQITKTYCATLLNQVPIAQQTQYISSAAQGLTLPPEKKAPEQKAAPAKIKFLAPKLAEITVTEGKFHEVRRIFKALDNEIVELERTAIGALMLPADLKAGEYKALSQSDFDFLLKDFEPQR